MVPDAPQASLQSEIYLIIRSGILGKEVSRLVLAGLSTANTHRTATLMSQLYLDLSVQARPR